MLYYHFGWCRPIWYEELTSEPVIHFVILRLHKLDERRDLQKVSSN